MQNEQNPGNPRMPPPLLSAGDSERIAYLRGLLIVGVVFVHAFDTQISYAAGMVGPTDSGGYASFIRNLISQGIARTAVPIFYFLSGYLFFLNFRWSWSGYRRKLRSRVNTLLIPFLSWNLLNLLFLIGAESFPFTQPYFSGVNEPVLDYSFYDFLNKLLGIESFPIAYQFWFIRDLMVIVLLCPLIHLLLRTAPKIGLGVVAGLWLFNFWGWYVPSVAALAFFYAGAYLSFHRDHLFGLDRHGPKLLVVYAMILVTDVLTIGASWHEYLHKIGIVVGIGAVFFLTHMLSRHQHLRAALLWASPTSFFVFAIHEPLLRVLRKVAYGVIQPESDLTILLLYFVIPLTVIALAMMVFLLMSKVTPTPLRILTGGRIATESPSQPLLPDTPSTGSATSEK